MSGLREQQKEMRRQAIRRAAVELFESQGYTDTTIEQIARQAGVTAPTVFNYFGSKQAILLEIFRDIDDAAIAEACGCIDDYADPLDALCRLEQAISDLTIRAFPASVWRELLPVLLSESTGGVSDSYRKSNERLQHAVADVLAKMKVKGMLREDLDVHLAARLLNEYSHIQLMRLTSRDDYDLEAHRKDVREVTGLILYGMIKS